LDEKKAHQYWNNAKLQLFAKLDAIRPKSSAAEGVENPNPQRLAVYYRRF